MVNLTYASAFNYYLLRNTMEENVPHQNALGLTDINLFLKVNILCGLHFFWHNNYHINSKSRRLYTEIPHNELNSIPNLSYFFPHNISILY